MAYDLEQICNFRKIGSKGLIVFERDGTLLKTNTLSRDLTLDDINLPLIRLLKNFRSRGIRFGFLSGTRAMDAAHGGRAGARALVDLMNSILRTDRAEPDFWMAMPLVRQTSRVKRQNAQNPASFSCMLQRAMEWYGVAGQKVVFVGSSSACALASGTAGISTVNYSASPLLAGESQTADPLEIQRIEAAVKSVLDSELDRQYSL